MRRASPLLLLLAIACQQKSGLSATAKLFIEDLEESSKDPDGGKHLTIEYSRPDLVFKLRPDASYTLRVHDESRSGVIAPSRRDAIFALLLRPQLYEAGTPRGATNQTLTLREELYDRKLAVDLEGDGELSVVFRNVVDETLKNSTEPLPKGYSGP